MQSNTRRQKTRYHARVQGLTPTTGCGLHYSGLLELGQGGMASVRLAVARGPGGFNKLVVLKTIRRHLAADEEIRQLFLQEAQISARLSHPNIVQVHEVIDHPITPAIVMEYLDGQPLSEIFQRMREDLGLGMQIRIMQDLLSGLHHSHELCDFDGTPLRIVHRDVSPQNVFVTYDGVVKVLDFGIAKVAFSPSQTRTGVVKGKLAYMPPEQLLGECVDQRTDIFAAGCIFWEMLVGHRLWQDQAESVVMRSILNNTIPRPSDVLPSIDPELERIVMKALAANPEDRYPTALEFSAELSRYFGMQGLTTSMRDLGTAVARRFAAERAERANQVRHALTASHPPPLDSPTTGPVPAEKGTLAAPAVSRRRRVWSVAAGLGTGALIATALVGALWWSREGLQVSTQGVTPADDAVVVQLEALPQHAVFTLDGARIQGNPTTLRLRQDGIEHLIQAHAEGFVAETRMVRFDRPVRLAFELKAVPPALPASDLVPETPSVVALSGLASPSSEPRGGPPPRARPRIGRSRVAPAPSPKVTPTPTATVATAQAPVPSPEDSRCKPPFVIRDGVKVFKAECF